MKSANLLLLIFAFFVLTSSSFSQPSLPPRNATVFTVNSVVDTIDADPGDSLCADSQGRCSLRAAIDEVNAIGIVGDGIMFALPNPSIIDLTLGELVLLRQFSIVGPGPDRLTVQRSFAPGTPDFRIFRLSGGGVTNIDLRGMTLKNGRSTDGGAIYVDQTLLKLNNVVVTGNEATNGGGLYSSGSVRITRSLFVSNTATNLGGAITLSSGSPPTESVISDSTITNNQASTAGGISNDRSLSLVNNTISHNSATSNISGVRSGTNGAIYVLNTIIGNDSSLPLATLSGAFTSRGNNIITDARNSSGFTDGVLNDRVGISNSINSMLEPLSNNGGGIDTRALQSGSPAINAGNNCVSNLSCQLPPGTNVQLSWDQRSKHSRIANGTVDIGAFEANATVDSFLGSYRVRSGQLSSLHFGSIVVLTNSATNEKKYSSVNPSGWYGFANVEMSETYLLEIRSKRSLLFAVTVIPQ